MLGQISGWIKGVLIVGLAGGLLKTLAPSGAMGKVFNFVSALALALTFLYPLAASQWQLSPGRLLSMAADNIPFSNDDHTDSSITIIETGLAAYISKRANELGLKTDVAVRAENLGNGQQRVIGVDIAYRVKPSREEVEALADHIEAQYGLTRGMQRHRYGRQDLLK